MTSTEIKLGLTCSARPSSRVLKPPGGGHSSIFCEQEVAINAPRPKNNQQNSSNLNACIGSTDANEAVVKLREEITVTKQQQKQQQQQDEENKISEQKQTKNIKNMNDNNNTTAPRGRVPPGGYSSGGFW